MKINPWKSDNLSWRHSHQSETDDSQPGDESAEEKGGKSYARQFVAAGEESGNANKVDKVSPSARAESTSFRDKFLVNTIGSESREEKQSTEAKEHSATAGNNADSSTKTDFGEQKEVKGENVKSGDLLKKLEEKRRKTPDDELPGLTKNAHKQLNRNFRELSLAEGNLRGLDRTLCTVYCTSCFEGEGKTTASVSVAFGLAEFGDCRVLLIDSNYETPQIHRLFGISQEPGLQELMSGSVSAEEAIVPTAYNGLYLLTAGDGEKPLSTVKTGDLLKEFKDNFDFVLIDGKTLFASSEVTNLAQLVDGYIVAVECEQTKWEVVQLAQDKLIKAGAQHAAVLLNKRRYYLPRFIYRLISRS